MSILERLGRQTVHIGSGSDSEVRLDDPRVPVLAALVVHRGSGKLAFIAEVDGLCNVDGRPLSAGTMVPFDFRSHFVIAGVEVPVTHEELCIMAMSRGHLRPEHNRITFGRDPARCHIVMSSPGVSAHHLTVEFPSATVIDHESTSGTWVQGHRLPAEQPVEVGRRDILAVGPLPLPVHLAETLHRELQVAGKPVGVEGTQAMAARTAERPVRHHTTHRTVMGTVKMVAASEYTIGRTADNDIVLDYAQVSGRHAKLVNLGGKLFIEDLGSELGTYVRGNRVRRGQRARVEDGEHVRFGPMPAVLRFSGETVDLVVEDHEGWAGRPLFEIEASDLSVVVRDRDDPPREKTLLEGVSFRALPGDLIALMGPSGSGKTTLLHALTGYVEPSRGQVRINGQPLSAIFDALRGSIGYVPQDDIIHPELTVREAVSYSARFRLPPDYSPAEIEERVDSTLRQLGLEGVSQLRIGTPEQKILSGGQRKRVNIAMELVTDPVLLFLDEPTSGLAADDTTALVELLARLAQETGKTIIATIHQPAREEYERFNLALVLGHGGLEIYFGPTAEAYGFFEAWRVPAERHGIENPRDMFAELSEREVRLKQTMPGKSRTEVRRAVSQAFRTDYENHPIRSQMHETGRQVGAAQEQVGNMPRRRRPRGQLRLLLDRYFKIKLRDRVGTAILLLQAPLIGVLLALVFGLQKEAIPYWCLGALEELSRKSTRLAEDSSRILESMQPTTDHAGALFFLVVAAVWFGTSNAAREVVSERAIFRRERMVNLGVLNYVLSKFLVLGVLCVLQCAVLLSVVFVALDLSGGASAFFVQLGMLVLTALCSVALGLLLSTLSSSSEASMALTPIALIPQVVLGGLMVPLTTNRLLEWPMKLMPSRWGFEGVIRPERAVAAKTEAWTIQLGDVPDSPPDFIDNGLFHCAIAQMQSMDLTGAWGFGSSSLPLVLPASVLVLMTAVLFAAVVELLRREV